MNALLLDAALRCGVKEPEKFISGCDRFYTLLTEANQFMNLTRITSYEEFTLKHAIDSLEMAEYFPELRERPLRMADIGCGGGFPSLILALAFPQWEIVPIDSTGKKIRFVTECAKQLGLSNVHPVQGRANELNRKTEFRDKFDLVTARAVAPAVVIFHDTDSFLRAGGRYIFYQTPPRVQEELPNLQKLCSSRHRKWDATPVFELPEDMGARQFMFSC